MRSRPCSPTRWRCARRCPRTSATGWPRWSPPAGPSAWPSVAPYPRLKLVLTCSTGIDHLDLAELRRRGLIAAHTPTYCSDEVADHALASILAGWRGLWRLGDDTRAGAGTRARSCAGSTPSASGSSAWAGSGRGWPGAPARWGSTSSATIRWPRRPTSRCWGSTSCWPPRTRSRSTCPARRARRPARRGPDRDDEAGGGAGQRGAARAGRPRRGGGGAGLRGAVRRRLGRLAPGAAGRRRPAAARRRDCSSPRTSPGPRPRRTRPGSRRASPRCATRSCMAASRPPSCADQRAGDRGRADPGAAAAAAHNLPLVAGTTPAQPPTSGISSDGPS